MLRLRNWIDNIDQNWLMEFHFLNFDDNARLQRWKDGEPVIPGDSRTACARMHILLPGVDCFAFLLEKPWAGDHR